MSSKKRNNKGYSLVELIVAMLVTSVIMLAVVSFISTAMNSYRRTNADAAIQVEAQIAANTLSDIIISSTKCSFEEATVSGVNCSLFTVQNNEGYYIIILDKQDDKIRLKKFGNDEVELDFATGELDSKATAERYGMTGNDKMLLASYAKDIGLYGLDTSLVQLELSFEFDGKSYVGNYMINRRNN